MAQQEKREMANEKKTALDASALLAKLSLTASLAWLNG